MAEIMPQNRRTRMVNLDQLWHENFCAQCVAAGRNLGEDSAFGSVFCRSQNRLGTRIKTDDRLEGVDRELGRG